MLATILIIILILFLVGALPQAGRDWGYAPAGGLGIVVLILIVLLLLGRI